MSKSKLPDPVAENDADQGEPDDQDEAPAEYGGRGGKEPTRYGDWEKNGRCIDF
jgi:hypothetical protein